jgi:hypothetical protein
MVRRDIALQRYLQRHVEPGLPEHSFSAAIWHDVLILPAYRESAAVSQRLAALPLGRARTLVILVLNRPDKDIDPSANAALRAALEALPRVSLEHTDVLIRRLNAHTDLYLLDMEQVYGPTPAACGVGLARKAGCDLALRWMSAGAISGHWLCCTDADATLPADYFQQLHGSSTAAAAAVFPFRHVPGPDAACNNATALYELRLHHYVLGLEYAGSPYAYHTLGSALAINAGAYAQVRGFPRRSGAEDFYVLNKLAKVGSVTRLRGSCIELESRRSARVPFGTGPAVEGILNGADPDNAALFYHPACFAALRAVITSLSALAVAPEQEGATSTMTQGLPPDLARHTQAALTAMNVNAALHHCWRHGKTAAQFKRHFHQWFDGFRTLKFIHALREAGWVQHSLLQLDSLEPNLWPNRTNAASTGTTAIGDIVRGYWGWR